MAAISHFADDIFKHIYLNENHFISVEFSLKIFSWGSNYQYTSIGSDNGLALNRRQAIIWTKGGLVYWHMYASLGLNELSPVAGSLHLLGQSGAYLHR